MWSYFDSFYMTDVKHAILDKSNEVHALLQKSGLAKGRTAAATRRAMEASYNFAIFETGSDKLVGYARIVTDYTTVYYLCDVAVDETCRGMGLGQKLLKWICVHEDKLTGLTGFLQADNTQELFEKYGFKKCVENDLTLFRQDSR